MKNNGLKKLALLLMIFALALPVCAWAEAAVQVSEEAKAACLQAGGELLSRAKTVYVVSPYGTQSVVLRSEPSDSYDALAMLKVGQELTAIGMCGEYSFVLLEDGSMGWLAGWLAGDEVR